MRSPRTAISSPADWHQAPAGQLARPTPRRSSSSSARAIRRASRIGRSRQGRRRSRDAEPEDLGRRALELSRGLGLCAEAAGRQRRDGARISSPRSTRTRKVLDSGARGSTTTFVERGIGDVLIAWENEAYLLGQGARPRQVRDRHAVDFDPGRAAVAVVDKVVDKHGTRKVAEEYLNISTAKKARRSRPRTSIARAMRRSPQSTRASSRQ